MTFGTREGILKHCTKSKARHLGDVGQRFLDDSHPGLEAQLANLSDEIAYNNHDVDDGLRAGLLSLDQLAQVPLFARFYDEVIALYGQDLSAKQIRHEVIRRMINYLVVDVIETSQAALSSLLPASIDAVRGAGHALIAFSPAARRLNVELKRFLYKNLYSHHQVYRITSKARRVIKALFDAFLADPKLLPPKFSERVPPTGDDADRKIRARLIADYIAGMTDRYALDEYDRLFEPPRLR